MAPHRVSAREAQVVDHIYTFDALLCKNVYSFVERCRFSKNNLITALMNSSAFLESRFYVHYRDLLLPVGAQYLWLLCFSLSFFFFSACCLSCFFFVCSFKLFFLYCFISGCCASFVLFMG